MQTYVDKNSNRKPLQDILPLDMPLGLCVEPTNLCNFKCVQCPVSLPNFSEIVGGRQFIDFDFYCKIIQDVKSMGKLKTLNLYGDGEPLMNKRIADMVKYAREADAADHITITTNAALLTEDMAQQLLSSGLSYLRVSVYSIYGDNFNKITRSKIDHNEVFNNVKRFREMRDQAGLSSPFIYVKMIDTYTDETEEFKKLYTGIADQINVERPMNWNGFDNIDLIGNIDTQKRTDESSQMQFYNTGGQSGYKKICTTGFHSLNVKSNGDVVICIVDWNKGTKVGNLKDESLSDVWFGKSLREFRKMQIEGRQSENVSCKNCKYMYCNPDNIDEQSNEFYNKILNHKPA